VKIECLKIDLRRQAKRKNALKVDRSIKVGTNVISSCTCVTLYIQVRQQKSNAIIEAVESYKCIFHTATRLPRTQLINSFAASR